MPVVASKTFHSSDLPEHLKKEAVDLKQLEDPQIPSRVDSFVADVWAKHHTNIKRMAKKLGVNVNFMAKAPPADLQDLAHKLATGFYHDLTAGYAESSGLQICIARAMAQAMVEGMEAKYGRKLDVEVLKALVISRCEQIFQIGVSPQNAVDGWNGREQTPGMQVSAPGEKIGYKLYVKAYHTDEFDLATRLIRDIHNLSAGSSAMVLCWAPDGPVLCHALSVSHATDGKIIAMDHEGAGQAQEITRDRFAQLIIYNTVALQDGKALTATNPEYEALMAFVAQMCQPIPVANDLFPDVMARKWVMIGNPGTGKSTMVNCYVGSLVFKSGVSECGKGVTYQLDVAQHDGVCFMDTPGLSDIARRTDAAHAIDAALRQGGDFKVVFLMTEEAGRLKPDDLTTMKLVLDAAQGQISAENYSIIINKCTKGFLKKLDRAKWIRNFHEACEARNIALTHHIHFAPLIEELDYEDDVVAQLDPDTQGFLDGAPHLHLDNKNLDFVKSETFEQVQSDLESMLAQAREEAAEHERAKAKRALEEQEEKRIRAEQDAARAQELADEAQKQAEQKIEEARQRAEQQDRDHQAQIDQQARDHKAEMLKRQIFGESVARRSGNAMDSFNAVGSFNAIGSNNQTNCGNVTNSFNRTGCGNVTNSFNRTGCNNVTNSGNVSYCNNVTNTGTMSNSGNMTISR